MARYREIPCEFYVCIHNCSKGRKDAEHNGICQKCKFYRPRAKMRILNKKKQSLDKIRRNENYD